MFVQYFKIEGIGSSVAHVYFENSLYMPDIIIKLDTIKMTI